MSSAKLLNRNRAVAAEAVRVGVDELLPLGRVNSSGSLSGIGKRFSGRSRLAAIAAAAVAAASPSGRAPGTADDPVDQPRLAIRQPDRELPPHEMPQTKIGTGWARSDVSDYELGHVVEQPAESWRRPRGARCSTRPAAVEEVDLEPGAREPLTRPLVPPAGRRTPCRNTSRAGDTPGGAKRR